MAVEFNPKSDLASPHYWGDRDVYDTALEPEHLPEVMLSKSNYYKSLAYLERGLNRVYRGDCTEIRYARGTTFDPPNTQLEDGSLIVLDCEILLTMDSTEISALHDGLRKIPASPPIKPPFTDYWRENIGNPMIGKDIALFPSDNVVYTRLLNWGIILSGPDGTRAVQEFDFGSAQIEENGIIYVPDGDRRGALATPLYPGIAKPITDLRGGRRALPRISRIDIVHPVLGKKERKRGKEFSKLLEKLGSVGVRRPVLGI